MTAADDGLRAALAEAMDMPIHEASWATGVAMLDSDVAAFRDRLAAALLPVVRDLQAEELEAAIARVQAVYDLQCPVMPSDHYVGAGAHAAHAWWEKVLGGRLDDLRDRAAALRGEAGR